MPLILKSNRLDHYHTQSTGYSSTKSTTSTWNCIEYCWY